MPYNLQLPNGVLLTNIPDNVSDEEVRKKVLQEYPDLGAKTSRTWAEAGADVLASLGVGFGQLAQFPGQVGQLAGFVTPAETTTGLQGLGQRLEAYAREQKSPVLQAKEAVREQKLSQAEGIVNEFGTAIKETVKDPTLLSSFFLEQVPNLIGSFGFGAVAKGGVKALMRTATEEAVEAAVQKAGLRGVLAGNAVMQGADIGTDTYNTIYNKLIDEKKMSPEQAQGIALAQGRIAAIEAAAISLFANRGLEKIGGTTIERMLARTPGGGGLVKGLTGEAVSEAVEEGGGALAKNAAVQTVFPETSLTKGVGAAAGLGALGGALLGGAAGVIGGPTEAQRLPAPGAAPAAPPVTPPAGALPAPPVAAPPAPSTPLAVTPEGELQRDLFGGVVPTQVAPDVRQMVGPEAPRASELARQQELAFPGQQELFTGAAPVQPPVTPTELPKTPEVKPIDLSETLKAVIDTAKADKSSSKLLRANNPATARVVLERAQSFMTTPDVSPVQALEQLYEQNKTGTYPAGTKPLSDAQLELLEASYHRLTGVDIEQAIRNRRLLGFSQADLFEGGEQLGLPGIARGPVPTAGPAEEPATAAPGEPAAPTAGGEQLALPGIPPVEPGAVGPTVGAPGQPAGVGAPGAPAVGQPAGVGVGRAATQPPTGGAAGAPLALNPEQAWNLHREEGVHPAFGELTPEEQAQWTQAVNAGRPNSVNFAGVMEGVNRRMAEAAPRTAAQVKEALDKHGVAMSQDIEAEITGKTFTQVLKFLMENGPPANREIAKALNKRAKELSRYGYTFKFHVARTPQDVRRFGGYSSGTLGRVLPSYANKLMDISVAGANSGQPFGGQLRTVTHESTHAVTAMLVEYGIQNPTTEVGRIVKELKALSNHVRKHLEAKVSRGEQLTPAENKVLNGSNALGNATSTGRRYNQEHEMVAHGMTSSFMQEVLETVPYTGKTTGFSRFIEVIRNLLGLSPKANTALSRVVSLTERILQADLSSIAAEEGFKKIREVPVAPIEAAVAAGPATIPGLGQPYTLPKLTKLQAPQTTGQQIRQVAQKVQKNWNDDSFWTKARIGIVDPGAGLTQTLSSMPVFSNGQLRADMLVRAFSQTINLIKNGVQSGIPVLNTDGTVIIQRSASNLARSQRVADTLDSNPIVRGSGMSGRDFVAEVARIKRGEEIMQVDADRRAKAQQMMLVAKAKMAQARNMRAVGEPLTRIVKTINEAKAIRRRYRDDLNVNRERQVTQAHIQWANQQVAAVPQMQEIFNIWRDNNIGLLNLWQDAGLLTQEQADYYRSMKNYVPLYAAREDLTPEKQESYAGKATGVKTVRELEHLSGSDLQRNIWENLERNYAAMTAAAFQNQTRRVAVRQLESLGAARIATRADDPAVNLRFKDPTSSDADSNGVVHAILDNPNDLPAFQMMHYELGPLLKTFSATTQVLRATALINPMFWIKQLIRDPMHATLVANSGIVTPFHSGAAFARVVTGRSEEARILAERGVIGQYDPTISLQEYLQQAGTEKRKPTTLDKMLHKVMQIHEASDAATRVALFKKAKAEGLKRGMSEEEATDYAVHIARESINFLVRGNSKVLNALRHMIPFMSASITSLDTLYRAATGYGLNPEEKAKAQRLFWSRAAVMSVLSALYAMQLQDDDDYKRLPDNVKDGNWLMPNPWSTDGRSFIKIPVPFEIGFLFKTLPEASVRYMSGTSTGKEVLVSFRDGLLRTLPGDGILIPQAVKPALEVLTNYSFFTKRPIEGMSDQGLPVAMRGSNASEMSKMLSSMGLDKVGLSPAKLDYLIQGYLAELGTFTTGIAGTIVAEAQGKAPPNKNIEEQPFFRAFMTNPNTSKAATDFYDINQTAQETVNARNQLISRGEKEAAKEFVSDEENRKLLAVAPVLKNIQSNMALVRRQINVIRDNPNIDPEDKRLRINELLKRYDQIAQRGYAVLEKAGIER